ncbi:PilW family protein [Gilvimarinus algae]|uniref:PilW family protein n=1 Tax=Gilvimarinus algae TaxID=3058037 RepID=A0ABT8T9K0_9GAMM|nr:PilW family protein [Gilvimarinus sp. SDUM040014]MDO3380795.1 PilW family protein [Gilvimarinus sp. SDUM040014]
MRMFQQRGLSLVELLISITIGLVLMTGIVQLFLSSKEVFTTQQGLSRLQETGRLAVEFISRDLRQAGYMGCAHPTDWNVGTTLNNGHTFNSSFEFGTPLQVYDAPPPNIALAPAPKAGTQILVAYTANDDSASVSQTNTSELVFIDLTTPAGEDCPSGICANDIVVVADCDKAMVFQVTGFNEVGAEVELQHQAGADPGNARTSWGGNPDNLVETFSEGAEVFKINTVAYYVAEDAEGNPGLYQKIGGDPSFELLRGVENLNISVGVDNNADRAADEYIDHGSVGANWKNVVALRVEVLVRTPEDKATSENQTYEFAGAEVTATDNRIRQVFTTTIGVRSKLP